MRIGYPCINNSIDCKSDRTFRLKSYSEERLKKTIKNNLDCLLRILEFNLEHEILFFRITSDLVPFASHPICQFNWQKEFKKRFVTIGNFIKKHRIRISMHPDQFILLNSLSERIYKNSIRELIYHADVMDLMELDPSVVALAPLEYCLQVEPKDKYEWYLRSRYRDKRFAELRAKIGEFYDECCDELKPLPDRFTKKELLKLLDDLCAWILHYNEELREVVLRIGKYYPQHPLRSERAHRFVQALIQANDSHIK